MMQVRVQVDAMTEAAIQARLAEIDPSLAIEKVSGAQTDSRRKPQGMEPFTYFVIAFSAHLAAGLTHELIIQQIKKKFEDKHVQVETTSDEE
jgi:hypothetical protein